MLNVQFGHGIKVTSGTKKKKPKMIGFFCEGMVLKASASKKKYLQMFMPYPSVVAQGAIPYYTWKFHWNHSSKTIHLKLLVFFSRFVTANKWFVYSLKRKTTTFEMHPKNIQQKPHACVFFPGNVHDYIYLTFLHIIVPLKNPPFFCLWGELAASVYPFIHIPYKVQSLTRFT